MSLPQYPPMPPGFIPPEPPVRPKLIESVAIATELWALVIIARAVAEFAQIGTLREMIHEQIHNAPKGTAPEVLDVWRAMSSTGFLVTLLAIGVLVVGGLTLMVMWFARSGYNWARLTLVAASIYVVVSTVWGLRVVGITPSWAAVPLIIGAVLAGGAVVALMRRDAETYCADMALFRQQSKMFGAMPTPAGWPTPPPPTSGTYHGGDTPRG